MTATQQTKTAKQVLSAMSVKVKSDVSGTMVRGEQAELLTCAAMLRAAGFDVLWFGSKMISAATKD
ncbi:hypothetical protein [Methylibium sp.]|uniref:hypothetical protein n=1 Tax=Methylibium sp. TaxID=2067992 RepID=UPI00181FD28B|nr:hypothetical protein [Methylibium sp.]MBA3591814.1 hypothetical protein [Methylibium sp.]